MLNYNKLKNGSYGTAKTNKRFAEQPERRTYEFVGH